MGTRSGGRGGGIGGRAAGALPGGGTPPPDDGRDLTYREKQGMIAGYKTVEEAREGGKKLFGEYDLEHLGLTSQKLIQSTILEEARLNGIDTKRLDLGRASLYGEMNTLAYVENTPSAHGPNGKPQMRFTRNFFENSWRFAKTDYPHTVIGSLSNPRKAAVQHEFAHVVQQTRISYSTMNSLNNTPGDSRSGQISAYARSNKLEEHAEAYASYRNGIKTPYIKSVLRSFPDERPKGVRNRRKKTGLD